MSQTRLKRAASVSPRTLVYKGAGLSIGYGRSGFLGGQMLAAGYDGGVCYAGFDGGPVSGDGALARLKKIFPEAEFRQDPRYCEYGRQITDFWRTGKSEPRPVPVILHGTDFQIAVWRALLNIPYGQTVSYQDIAQIIDKPKACRAVGNAVGANPVSLLVPCHRVLPASRNIGNYGWGPEMKEMLLKAEGAV